MKKLLLVLGVLLMTPTYCAAECLEDCRKEFKRNMWILSDPGISVETYMKGMAVFKKAYEQCKQTCNNNLSYSCPSASPTQILLKKAVILSEKSDAWLMAKIAEVSVLKPSEEQEALVTKRAAELDAAFFDITSAVNCHHTEKSEDILSDVKMVRIGVGHLSSVLSLNAAVAACTNTPYNPATDSDIQRSIRVFHESLGMLQRTIAK
ncbi:MAG: hypothetical protein PHW69_03945 [Elusimicrobiaceae bacterium]|nr:hypothetical protein [Elusimicrobiaceae bacterium]